MDLIGERRLPATREVVWAALQDQNVLRAAIPGCKSIESAGEGVARIIAAVRVGPVAAPFTCDVRLLDHDPPRSCRVGLDGQGGAAGFAKGDVTVILEQTGDEAGTNVAETTLRYTAAAEIGGKLAQLGTRLIDASVRQVADEFLDRIAAYLADSSATGAPAAATVGAGPQDKTPANTLPSRAASLSGIMVFGLPPVFWVGAAIFLFIFVMMFSGYL